MFQIIRQQAKAGWLVDRDNLSLLAEIEKLVFELNNWQKNHTGKPKILLIEADPIRFIAGFFAAVILETPIFLGNPNWQSEELEWVKEFLQPNLIYYGDRHFATTNYSELLYNSPQHNIIGIPTGGSSGKIRFAIHTPQTLSASVAGFARYFELDSINSCCTLPLYHVSGLMQLWRSLITKGNLTIVPYQNLKQGHKPNINPQDYFLSLVPTQLQFLLEKDAAWLREFKTILLGGAPAWRSLLEKARQNDILIATTYGMTETASGIAYLKPQQFLLGNYSSGKVLPHATIAISNTQSPGDLIDIIKIQGDSLFYGYYPKYSTEKHEFITDDLGFFDPEGYLHIVGRNSQKIITGGENVYPQEVETAILNTKFVKDVCVIGLEDEQWGQVVTALYVPLDNTVSQIAIQQKLQNKLSKYRVPKYWLSMPSLRRNNKGKIDYVKLKATAKSRINKRRD